MDEVIGRLIQLINIEDKAQNDKFNYNDIQGFRQLKANGVLLHPIKVINKQYGFADYPEFEFKLPFTSSSNFFRNGAAIELILQGEPAIKGTLLIFDGKKGEARLFANEYPDWIEDNGVAIKLAPDAHTTAVMKSALKNLAKTKQGVGLFSTVYNLPEAKNWHVENGLIDDVPVFENLNDSQNNAVQEICSTKNITIIHGPPGTGKTTTITSAIQWLAKREKKILLAAPSNTAVDHVAKILIGQGVKILRIGNNTRIDAQIAAHTIEGKMGLATNELKQIKELRKQADALRKMALQYKRHFGKAEREQRNLILKEVKEIGFQIKKILRYSEEKFFGEAQVVLGTPVAIVDANMDYNSFDYLFVDEAGQCLEPLGWACVPFSERIVLAGDHLQLPPTVISERAARQGFNISFLERCMQLPNVVLLDTQYRMRSTIANFSSQYFYENKIKTPDYLTTNTPDIFFIDTAGTGFNEEVGEDGVSLLNYGELKVANAIADTIEHIKICFLTPYNGQVEAARLACNPSIKISTIDSMQGQEAEAVILSLVRSNDENNIGFLSDYRRMNVAITRAQKKLYVIGDSATLALDKFFSSFIEYVQANGTYQSAWEFPIWD